MQWKVVIVMYDNNIFYNLGYIKGKLEILSDTNIPRTKLETLNIIYEIDEKIDLIYNQVLDLQNKKIKKIEVSTLQNRYF